MITSAHKRILILGDSGRGKTTFAAKLSEKIGIPHYSTDDFFWKVRFTEPNDSGESVEKISEIYRQDKWIMEGGTRRLIKEGIEKADIIYFLKFKNIIYQFYFLIKRNLGRKNESFKDLFNLLKHITYKKYKKGYGGHMPLLNEMLKPYTNKIVYLNSLREINKSLESISKRN